MDPLDQFWDLGFRLENHLHVIFEICGLVFHFFGDVIISVETALRQALEKDHSFGTEMEILLVHGILHLLGYDHVDDDDAIVMQSKEQEILDRINVKW